MSLLRATRPLGVACGGRARLIVRLLSVLWSSLLRFRRLLLDGVDGCAHHVVAKTLWHRMFDCPRRASVRRKVGAPLGLPLRCPAGLAEIGVLPR